MFILYLKFNIYWSIFRVSVHIELRRMALHNLFPFQLSVLLSFPLVLVFTSAILKNFCKILLLLTCFIYLYTLYLPLLISLKYVQFISRHLTSPSCCFSSRASKYSHNFWSFPTLSIVCVCWTDFMIWLHCLLLRVRLFSSLSTP